MVTYAGLRMNFFASLGLLLKRITSRHKFKHAIFDDTQRQHPMIDHKIEVPFRRDRGLSGFQRYLPNAGDPPFHDQPVVLRKQPIEISIRGTDQ